MEYSSSPDSPMEPVDLLLDLSLNDGLGVVVDAVANWASCLVPSGTIAVSEEVRQYARYRHDKWYHAEIEKWPPRRFWEMLMGDFHRRMRRRGPIEEARPPSLTRVPRQYDEAELKRRAHALAHFAHNLTITQALDLFEKIVEQWSLSCDEEWIEQKHNGHIFYLLAQLTDR